MSTLVFQKTKTVLFDMRKITDWNVKLKKLVICSEIWNPRFIPFENQSSDEVLISLDYRWLAISIFLIRPVYKLIYVYEYHDLNNSKSCFIYST